VGAWEGGGGGSGKGGGGEGGGRGIGGGGLLRKPPSADRKFVRKLHRLVATLRRDEPPAHARVLCLSL
jgi:hypothetical protein